MTGAARGLLRPPWGTQSLRLPHTVVPEGAAASKGDAVPFGPHCVWAPIVTASGARGGAG